MVLTLPSKLVKIYKMLIPKAGTFIHYWLHIKVVG